MRHAPREFLEARDLLLRHRSDYSSARREFRWPVLDRFNWALDHFDTLGRQPGPALVVVDDDGRRSVRTFDDLTRRSNQLASLLIGSGVRRGERVLVMLPNVVELWEAMLACIKIGAVVVPATLQLTRADIEDRVARGAIAHVITEATGRPKVPEGPALRGRFTSEEWAEGWISLKAARELDSERGDWGQTRATDPMLLYFTSGTTAKPKLVLHTHQSYPVGHLSTMYWIGLRPGDVHWNISSPGWAKHAWSNVFAPWNAGATVLVHNTARFSARRALQLLSEEKVTTLCAPPTVWRMLILEDLRAYPVHLREAVAAGEPLNPEVIAQVERAWGITVRDGFGQTETTALVGNSPGQRVKPGSMGRALPGYDVALLAGDAPADVGEGELCLRLDPRPLGLMVGYEDDAPLTDEVMRGGHYHTGDVATRDADGYITYVGRTDDVFKASDYRISPFELESVLLEHPAVAEAAVVPSPDALRLAVPKAFVVLAPGQRPSAELAREIMAFVRARVAPYKRVRRLEFALAADTAPGQASGGVVMPKTISGKIRRVDLRTLEAARAAGAGLRDGEFVEAEGT